MKKTFITIATVLTSSVFSASAFANTFSFHELKPSVRIQTNFNDQSANFISSGVFAGGLNESRTSMGIFAGVKFNKFLGAEIGYTDLGKVFGTSPTNANHRGEATSYAIPMRLVAEYTTAPGIKLSGKIGLAYVDGKYKYPTDSIYRDDTRVTYGFGASYALAPKVDLALNVDRYKLHDAGLNNTTTQASIGIQYTF